MKKPVSTKTSELLGVLSQTPHKKTSFPQEKPAQESVRPQPPMPEAEKAEKRTKAIAFSLHPEDIDRIRQLSLWFSAQGTKVTDSMIIRCALRLAEPGQDLMDAYHKARQLDQRVKKPKQQ